MKRIVSNIHCGSYKPHEEHDYSLERGDHCNGMTRCGERAHEPHDMVYDDVVHCLGICECQSPTRMHAPSLHAAAWALSHRLTKKQESQT